MVDACRKSPQPRTKPPAGLFGECETRGRPVVETAHREIAVSLTRPEMSRRFSSCLKVAPANLDGVVLSHRVAKPKTGVLLVVGEDVRDTERIAPDLDAVRRRPLALPDDAPLPRSNAAQTVVTRAAAGEGGRTRSDATSERSTLELRRESPWCRQRPA